MIRSTLRHTLSLSLLALTAAFAGSACSSDDDPKKPNNSSTDDSCPGSQCAYADSACLAIGDNEGSDRTDLRITQLNITFPEALKNPFLQRVVINQAMRLAYDESCNYSGDGRFSWLFSWDRAAKKLLTGGGPPIGGEAGAKNGTCFINFTDEKSGIEVKPQELDLEINEDGTFSASGIDVTVPIFLPAGGSVLLPLRQVTVATLPGKAITDNDGNASPSGNCVGSYRKDLDPADACFPADEITYFENGASLEGFITVEEAEGVWIADMSTSLCVLLGKQADDIKVKEADGTHCKRDGEGNIILKGDWDSATNQPVEDGTGDAFRLKGEFAANAVKILGTATKMDCSDAS